MTSVSWVIPALERLDQEKQQPQPSTPSINTCRPMSYQEDGAKVSHVVHTHHTHTHTPCTHTQRREWERVKGSFSRAAVANTCTQEWGEDGEVLVRAIVANTCTQEWGKDGEALAHTGVQVRKEKL